MAAHRCRFLSKESINTIFWKPRNCRNLHRHNTGHFAREKPLICGHQYRCRHRQSVCLLSKRNHLSQLSARGLSFSNFKPDDSKYIGQPTHVTHPHLIAEGEVTPGITKKEYNDRRHNLMRILGQTHYGSTHDKHLVIIPSNPVKYMATDIPYPFRQNTDFLYLTGFQEPDSVLLLETQEGNSFPHHRNILFVRPRNPKRELWEGSRAGVEGAKDIFGMDEAYSVEDLTTKIIERYSNKDYCIWYDHFHPTHLRLHAQLKQVLFGNTKFSFKNLLVLGHNLQMVRLIKSPAEIKLLRKSSAIASEALKKVMKLTQPGLEESYLEINMDYECRINGAQRLSYPPVVAGGSLANTLHYINNTQLLRDGDLVLMDAGCEYHGYASDITRTWPVNGRFTEPQRQLYDIVLRVNKKCIALCRKNAKLDVIHHAMLVLLGEELVTIGILSKRLTEAERKKAASEFCPHHVGHYLGMDTHDTHLISRGLGLQPNMVVTIEPGLYIPTNAKHVPERYRGIGIRIEDDVLITDNGNEVLSRNCPKEPDEIEKHMQR